MQNAGDAVPSADLSRITGNIENWKRKLLDLTKRNKALNFKPTKTATVLVTDEQPAEVFKQLVVKELAFRFKAKPESKEERAIAKARQVEPQSTAKTEFGELRITALGFSDGPVADEEDFEFDNHDFAPYDASTVEDRHRDDFLQTALTPEALDKSLRRLDEQSRLSIEEQGVNTMFLALGSAAVRGIQRLGTVLSRAVGARAR